MGSGGRLRCDHGGSEFGSRQSGQVQYPSDIRCAFWNIAGFYNGTSKLDVIRHNIIKADIFCMVETRLVKEQVIEIPGYTWYGNNRAKYKRQLEGQDSGGWVYFVRILLRQFSITVLDNNYEDIISISLTNNHTTESMGICACYLPPIKSSRGDKHLQYHENDGYEITRI